jgi:biopolymer transport protein ExbD
MAASANSNGDETFATINVTPLVDIMLVLLVVFMVTARLIAQSSVPMDLPRASTGSTQQTIWNLAISEDGQMRLDGEPVSAGLLRERARLELAKTPELRAVISASRNARHGAVVLAMDELRQGGLTRIAFGVSPEGVP